MLIVPNRADVDRVERELLRRRHALLGGSIGTFDDVFEQVVAGTGERRRSSAGVQRALLVRGVVGGADLRGYSRSAAQAGFVDSLERTLDELEEGLLAPAAVEGELGVLYAGYCDELDRLGRWDLGLLRSQAVERLHGDLDAWHGQPVFAYGFEDLTGAEWGVARGARRRPR